MCSTKISEFFGILLKFLIPVTLAALESQKFNSQNPQCNFLKAKGAQEIALVMRPVSLTGSGYAKVLVGIEAGFKPQISDLTVLIVSMKVLLLCVLALSNPVLSRVEILDLYEDWTSSDSNEDNKVTNLPGVSEFARGLDYSTGERKNLAIFKFTYAKSESGDPDFLYDDNIQGLTYKIPDQLTAANWVSECSTKVRAVSKKSHSVSDYLKSVNSASGCSFDQKVDISVSVPVGEAELSASTQIRNTLGYGKSKGTEEYKYRMTDGHNVAIDVQHTAALWSVEWKLYDESANEEIKPNAHFSSDFKGSVDSLVVACTTIPPDRESRQKGIDPIPNICDSGAAILVANFGTHYNKIGRFGGLVTQNYYYNREATSSKQRELSQKYSKYEFGLLFFNSAQESQENETLYKENNMEKTVISGQERIYGGDASSSSSGAWCTSVRRQPAIITDTKVIAISDLIDDENAKFAVKMAIMDKWVCNGGTAINYNEETSTVKCKCPFDSGFQLDELCLPKTPRCYENLKEVPCQFGKIIAEYTPSYTLAWNDAKSGATNNVALYVPNPLPGYQLVGTIAQRNYKVPTDPVIVIEPSTPEYLATAATSFTKIYEDRSTGATLSGSVWRPVCPDGYSSVSDFAQKDYNWPSPLYSDLPLRPCIVNRCLRVCRAEWIWDDRMSGGSQNVAFWRLAGGSDTLGSSVGEAGGFFRATKYWTITPEIKYLYCIKPECVVEA